jgi:presenilin enhancer 2
MDPTEDVMDYETKVSVSKKLYYGGFFLLPWLWFANFLLFRGDLHKRRAPEELKTCPYLVATDTKRSLILFLGGTILFIIWIIVYQLSWKNWGTFGEAISLVIPRGS